MRNVYTLHLITDTFLSNYLTIRLEICQSIYQSICSVSAYLSICSPPPCIPYNAWIYLVDLGFLSPATLCVPLWKWCQIDSTELCIPSSNLVLELYVVLSRVEMAKSFDPCRLLLERESASKHDFSLFRTFVNWGQTIYQTHPKRNIQIFMESRVCSVLVI